MKYEINNKKTSWRIVTDEEVIINSETRVYYNLNPAGTYIWKLLAKSPVSFDEILGKFADKYKKRKVKLIMLQNSFYQTSKKKAGSSGSDIMTTKKGF